MRETSFKQKVMKFLESEGFETLNYFGSFDMAARSDELYLIKVLFNVEALKDWQARNLRIFSYFFNAKPVVVSHKTNRAELDDNTVYNRHGIAVTKFKLFKKLIRRNEVTAYSVRGKRLVEIDRKKLYLARKSKGLSLAKLSEISGISKKCLYEIEKGRIKPREETARILENVLGVRLIEKISTEHIFKPKKEKLIPQDEITMRVYRELESIGAEVSAVERMPFQLISKLRKTLMVKIGSNDSDIIRSFADFFDAKYLVLDPEKKLKLSKIKSMIQKNI